MKTFFLAAALVLLGTMAAGMARIARGPTPADRMLAALLFGTTGVAVLLLLAEALPLPAAVDVALAFAVLAAVVGVAFAARSRGGAPAESDEAA
jgi:multicomponent Na+:H+ antiporter subunit F